MNIRSLVSLVGGGYVLVDAVLRGQKALGASQSANLDTTKDLARSFNTLSTTPGVINYITHGSPGACHYNANEGCVQLQGTDLNWISTNPESSERAFGGVDNCPISGAPIGGSSPYPAYDIIVSASGGENVVVQYNFTKSVTENFHWIVCRNTTTTYSVDECTNCDNDYYSAAPSRAPTHAPTGPSVAPTHSPTRPTVAPTTSHSPTITPTKIPTVNPSRNPTLAPSLIPTVIPSKSPTKTPTLKPTFAPTRNPTTASPSAVHPGEISYVNRTMGNSACNYNNNADMGCVKLIGSGLDWVSTNPSSSEQAFAGTAGCPNSEVTIGGTSPYPSFEIIGYNRVGSNLVVQYPFETAVTNSLHWIVCAYGTTTYSIDDCTNCNQDYYTLAPTRAPTLAPTTDTPSYMPSTHRPSLMPTLTPSIIPTRTPSVTPTRAPSAAPTKLPSAVPTVIPSFVPTAAPTVAPTVVPSYAPTNVPSASPTIVPTMPTAQPTISPTFDASAPTPGPTVNPTAMPTVVPSVDPTVNPTVTPTAVPSIVPTITPTVLPTHVPTVTPTESPSFVPTVEPSFAPTNTPTVLPSEAPTVIPSVIPSTDQPTYNPTLRPSFDLNDDTFRTGKPTAYRPPTPSNVTSASAESDSWSSEKTAEVVAPVAVATALIAFGVFSCYRKSQQAKQNTAERDLKSPLVFDAQTTYTA